MHTYRLNSGCKSVTHETVLDSQNALEIIENYDVIVDATDNVATRYLLNDASVLLNKPLISGSALRMDGQVFCFSLDIFSCRRWNCKAHCLYDPSS